MVTAETAMVLPALVLAGFFLFTLVLTGSAHLQLVDSTREVARMIARGDDHRHAVSAGKKFAPQHTRFQIQSTQGFVTVSARTQLPLFGGLFDLELDAESVVTDEMP